MLYLMIVLEIVAAIIGGHFRPWDFTLLEVVVYGTIIFVSSLSLYITSLMGFRIIPRFIFGFSIVFTGLMGLFLYPVIPEGETTTIHYDLNKPAIFNLEFTMSKKKDSNVIFGEVKNTGDRYIKSARVLCFIPDDMGNTAHTIEANIFSHSFISNGDAMSGQIFSTYKYSKMPHVDVSKTVCGIESVKYVDIDVSNVDLDFFYNDAIQRYEFEITNNSNQILTQVLVSCTVRDSYQKIVLIRQMYQKSYNNELNIHPGGKAPFMENDSNYTPDYQTCKLYSVRFEK